MRKKYDKKSYNKRDVYLCGTGCGKGDASQHPVVRVKAACAQQDGWRVKCNRTSSCESDGCLGTARWGDACDMVFYDGTKDSLWGGRWGGNRY